jgi:hypothetical protein
MKNGKENESTSRKHAPIAILFITNPTYPDPGSNLGRRFGKPAANFMMVTFTAELCVREAAHLYFIGAQSLLTL